MMRIVRQIDRIRTTMVTMVTHPFVTARVGIEFGLAVITPSLQLVWLQA